MQVTPQSIGKAVNVSFAKFDHFRRARGRFMTQMAGRFYQRTQVGDREERKAAPINLLAGAVGTLVPNLVYNDPKVKIRTDILAYRDYSNVLELAVNHLANRLDLRMALRKVIVDSILMAGFIKTGIASADQFVTTPEGHTIELGEPYAERVDPDDIILDPMARDWDEQSFTGNRFRANLDDLQATGLYDNDLLDSLSNRYDGMNLSQSYAEKIIGDNTYQQYREVQRFVDLVEVYLPREQIVVTLPYQKEQTFDKFMRVADYEGPDTGPYHMLGYMYVPDNILPVAPAALWYDLHIMGNRIARKLGRQAERLKRVLAYTGQAQEDANEIAEADDGETVKVDAIDQIKEVTFGGADDKAFAWMAWVKQTFSEQAGNLDLLQGTDTDSPTATQAQMLQANSSVRLADMQNQVYSFTAEVSRDLVFFLHTDPLIQLPLVQRVNGAEQQVMYTPEMKRGEWLDYNVKVQPYSMAKPDPNTAVRRKIEFATNVIPGAAQAAALLGPGFDVGMYLKGMARDVGIEDADEWLNTPAMQAWIMQRMMMNTGDPGKAGMMVQPPIPGAASQPVINPNQPNPTAMGPTGGISPQTEQAMAQQEVSGQLQSAYHQPSVNALAQMK